MADELFGSPPTPVNPANPGGIPVITKPENIAAVKQLMANPEVVNPIKPATDAEKSEAAGKFGAPLDTPTAPEAVDSPEADPLEGWTPKYTGSPFDNREFHQLVDKRAGAVKLDTSLGEFGRLYQWVPIFPGKLEAYFCTPSGEESLWIGRRVAGDDVVGFFAFRLDDLATCLRMLRGDMFGQGELEFEDPFGLVDGKLQWREEVLLENISQLRRLPNNILHILLKQLEWFNLRVDRAMADLRNC